MVSPAVTLSTAALTIEPLRVDHAAAMLAVLADAALYEHTGGEPPTLGELTARYERQLAGSPAGGEQWLNWIAVERSTGAAVGFVQATVRDAAELAWLVGVRWQGRGYATEAAKAVRQWLQAQGVLVFEAHIADANIPSRRVAAALLLEPTEEFVDGERTWRGRRESA
ncbi:GNAT family N-acetyltransferase [Subtercola sp. YIM 133946]|uniref:GNAT family N-acetyltransferase n=1 Tax=Subtercola sp. YIM 133946 TaxID=3118909 RepID=UPI002F9273E6